MGFRVQLIAVSGLYSMMPNRTLRIWKQEGLCRPKCRPFTIDCSPSNKTPRVSTSFLISRLSCSHLWEESGTIRTFQEQVRNHGRFWSRLDERASAVKQRYFAFGKNYDGGNNYARRVEAEDRSPGSFSAGRNPAVHGLSSRAFAWRDQSATGSNS